MRRRNIVLLGVAAAVVVTVGLIVAGQLRWSVLPFIIIAVTRLAAWLRY